MLSDIRTALWDSFIDSSHDILKQIEVLAVSKMKDNLKQPSYELSHRSGNLARAVQNAPISTEFADGALASATAKVDSKYGYLLVEGCRHQVKPSQKPVFRYLGWKAKKDYPALAEMYFKMGHPNSSATLYGRPYINEAIEEVNWFDVVKKNINTKVKNEIKRIKIG